MHRISRVLCWLAAVAIVLSCAVASAQAGTIYDITVNGTSAIFLAGRDDLTIPPPGTPWSILTRHPSPTPENLQEEFPPMIPVTAGDVIRAADPAVGGVNFFRGFGPPFFGPQGNGVSGSNLNPVDGISGYRGPQGALVGVFLDDNIPNAGPPATLNFDPDGLGTDFLSLNPLIGQIFYIGNGLMSGGDFREYIAPAGATRLFLGIPDGFSFVGNPGAYDDNDGSYSIRIGVNVVPTEPIPEPSTVLFVLSGLALLALGRKRLQSRPLP
jgi:hypothetical protein